jgi:integrase
VFDNRGDPTDLSQLAVPQVGSLETTEDLFQPYRLLDAAGAPIRAADAFFAELLACGRSAATLRSYGMDLLRWFRFISAVGVEWDKASRVEARDFCRWLTAVPKPARAHWRRPDDPPVPARARGLSPNTLTGKRSPGLNYAPATVAHAESVLRAFYDFHLEAGTGPMVNPFPLVRGARRGRIEAHHNPLEPFERTRRGRYRPKLTARAPRMIPDDVFDQLFAKLSSHRDRALVAFYVSSGVRAAELLGATVGDADPGQQLISVVRKGSRALQLVPASPDAFVWLRLYQTELDGEVPTGRDQPLWWTLRRPHRPLSYDAARAMFNRANAALGANWSLHDLRHTACHRMARDPSVPLSDISWVMGHAHLSTTQRYLNPQIRDVIETMLAFYAKGPEPRPTAAGGYRKESIETLFGEVET